MSINSLSFRLSLPPAHGPEVWWIICGCKQQPLRSTRPCCASMRPPRVRTSTRLVLPFLPPCSRQRAILTRATCPRLRAAPWLQSSTLPGTASAPAPAPEFHGCSLRQGPGLDGRAHGVRAAHSTAWGPQSRGASKQAAGRGGLGFRGGVRAGARSTARQGAPQ